MTHRRPAGHLPNPIFERDTIEPGHGLWVVRQLGGQLSLDSGPHGTTVTVSFPLGPADDLPPLRLGQHV
jgi:hypothetical protein